MSRLRFLTRRALFALFATYLVVSITFGFIALTADPQLAVVAYGAAQAPPGEYYNQSEAAEQVNEAVSAYEEAYNLDEPVEKRYVTWLVNVATFDWGESLHRDRAVVAMVGEAVPKTAAYVLPAMLLSLVGGISAGVFAAYRRRSAGDYLVTGLGYLAFSVPNFLLGGLALLGLALLTAAEGRPGLPLPTEVRTVVLPALVLGGSLFAGQLRHARSEALEHFGEAFVKLLRAKGAGPVRVARHVLKNAAIPLVSLFFAELLAVLVVNIYVLEQVFRIQGLGSLSLWAIGERDLPVVLGTTMVLVFVGIAGNFLQDVAYAFLDPRVEEER
ncbi:ABC transporter permease [Halorarius halobius]|uniref:ABC transporter permease n=1 Tax=Halorarius halobius TaxID=2962671 RepID=UPI0020CF3F9C|nr:ABC transporter permease [Halorarius halobius]